MNRPRRGLLQVVFVIVCLSGVPAAFAGPNVEAGDYALRRDIQKLADAGVITGTIFTWPLAWAPIVADLDSVDAAKLSPALVDAVNRVRSRAAAEYQVGRPMFRASLAGADNPAAIRSFEDTPRGKLEASMGVDWSGSRFAAELNVQYVDSDQDDDEVRLDKSLLGVRLGNWLVAGSTQERWWGPSWDGSLILADSARPIPSLTIDRVMTDAFETKWLSWIGSWDVSVLFGQLESARAVPDTRFFGLRIAFRPLSTLEIGLSRTALWCGDGRPCGFDTFVDLFLGKDNIGDDGVDADNEPGNQLAGLDARWTPGFAGHNLGLYGQFIGEDEAGGFPSRWMGQAGMDYSARLLGHWDTTFFGELSATICQFYESSKRYNCAYNHNIYETGYRYRDRSIGHGADNDTLLATVGLIAVNPDNTQWRVHIRAGELNRGGPPDYSNSITPEARDVASFDIAYVREFGFGIIDVGAGVESLGETATEDSNTDARFYLQWRSSY